MASGEQKENMDIIKKPETKVALFAILTLFSIFILAKLVGIESPFSHDKIFYVTYKFAGGIDIGSPVRVSGIKVGKVEKIEFFVPIKDQIISFKEPGSPNLTAKDTVMPLRIRISIRNDAAQGVKQDSHFYINLAGLIGERYIEVTPGTETTALLEPGQTVAGIDPPRIDQLLSQSFDLAGKISDIISENKGDLTRSLDLIYKLSGNLNKTLNWVDKSAVFKTDLAKLIENFISITTDVRRMTEKSRSPEGEKTLKLMYDLLWRLEPLDQQAVRNFLQKEGVKVKIF